jgi:TetR/AcrR family transcriptional repressor of nem operon
MSRAKQFDPQAAVLAATDLFWRQGYADTSLADLEARLCVGRKSLYDTFGSKKDLFLLSLDAYLQTPYPIARKGAGWPEIVEMFEDGPPYDPRYRACLFANTILEFGTHADAEVSQRIGRHLARLQRLFARALERAIRARDVPAVDVPATARYLTSSLQGLSIMAKGGASVSALRSIATCIVASVAR